MSAAHLQTRRTLVHVGELAPDTSCTRFGARWKLQLKALLGLPSQRRLAQAALTIEAVRAQEKELAKLTDVELKQYSTRLKGRARGGESLNKLLPEAFGLVCVAAWRTIQLRPFDVQIAAGAVIHNGALTEVATGEGKTLIASLPTYLNALTGKGVHVTTVNDYLAKRDAEWIGPIYDLLGMSLGILQMQMDDQKRVQAYKSDITYGTASEFGFDFLRDRLKLSQNRGQSVPFWTAWMGNGAEMERSGAGSDPRVQRTQNFAIVDEADSIFIDEAKTPLIISAPTRMASNEEQVVYKWANVLAQSMQRDVHFKLDEKKGKIDLSEEGMHKVRWSNPPFGPHSHAMDKLHEHVERAIQAHHRFRRDQHYMVEKEKVVIIDEYTGRRMPDRHWREGLHQAVEAKEGVPVTLAADHAAQLTFQSYFKLYKKLAGMTGTAAQNWPEIRRVYRLWVVCVPTNRPIKRQQLADQVFPTEKAKFDAVVADVVRLHGEGRPVLIGTRSVDKSEELSQRFKAAGVPHSVLSARYHEQEAHVVSEAGQRGRVMIATNMAGRGTDIKLAPGVGEVGGLHVLGTERHDARRIDRQLAGRAGRQGDPGTCQFYLSLEDELLEGLGADTQNSLQELGQRGGSTNWQKFRGLFLKAQRRVERRHRRQRVDLMMYEKQRQEILKDLGADPYVD